MALTPKQQRFVQEYLVDLNATQAAIRACYSVKTAASIGQENLTKPEIQAAVQAAQAARAARTEVTQDWVVQRLVREADREGEGSSHSARVSAVKLIGDHLGMFKEKTPLEQMLASLPAELAAGIRQELARLLQSGGVAPGGSAGPPPGPPG